MLNDTSAAEQFYLRADFIEDSKSSTHLPTETDNGGNDSDINFITSHTTVGKRDFVVIMDKTCIIRDVNNNVQLFGWRSDDLIGKDISILFFTSRLTLPYTLIPEPFKRNHSNYVMRHLSSGVTHIIGVGNRRLPLVQKDGTCAAILLSVTKVGNSPADC